MEVPLEEKRYKEEVIMLRIIAEGTKLSDLEKEKTKAGLKGDCGSTNHCHHCGEKNLDRIEETYLNWYYYDF